MKFNNPQTEREQQDLEANAFAIALLLPEKPIIELLKMMDGIQLTEDDPNIMRIANELGVTYGLLMFRIGQLWERHYCK